MSNYSIRFNFEFVDLDNKGDLGKILKVEFRDVSTKVFKTIQQIGFVPNKDWKVEVANCIPEVIIKEVNFKLRTSIEALLDEFYENEGEITKISMGLNHITLNVKVLPKPNTKSTNDNYLLTLP
ncbi:hypothetical protein [Flectobacillus sp. BAB-3569]|uniref:hypothetical protein n=1 Tax=Flectobacillus sp. BAB-3569 TaxID=1509483 RepID=UPI000BA4B4A8|nr:hypothetical protein [Flectobacillus sp. BAB-3569]PAC27818.1 hypothetical protein BWI92_21640 [Flectobacillus sp. BAB-3569]